MSDITPSIPSFAFNYWRPWKEGCSVIDSYLDYRKDISLVKYGADSVGKYIQTASKEQVNAINKVGYCWFISILVLPNDEQSHILSFL